MMASFRDRTSECRERQKLEELELPVDQDEIVQAIERLSEAILAVLGG